MASRRIPKAITCDVCGMKIYVPEIQAGITIGRSTRQVCIKCMFWCMKFMELEYKTKYKWFYE